jgi:hypothetical protein
VERHRRNQQRQREVMTRFFSFTDTHPECVDYAAKQLANGDRLEPLERQGSFSYSFRSTPKDKRDGPSRLIQFRLHCSHICPRVMEKIEEAFGDFIPTTMFWYHTIGQTPLSLYVMDYVPSITFASWRKDHPLFHPNKLANTMADLSRFFRMAWQSARKVSFRCKLSIYQDLLAKFTELTKSLPETYTPTLTNIHSRLYQFFNAHNYPIVLTHPDLTPKNVLVDPITGRIRAIIGWSHARLQPFGMSFWAIDHFTGYLDAQHRYHRYETPHDIDEIFWEALWEPIGRDTMIANLRPLQLARDLSSFVRYGYRWIDGLVSRLSLEEEIEQAWLNAVVRHRPNTYTRSRETWSVAIGQQIPSSSLVVPSTPSSSHTHNRPTTERSIIQPEAEMEEGRTSPQLARNVSPPKQPSQPEANMGCQPEASLQSFEYSTFNPSSEPPAVPTRTGGKRDLPYEIRWQPFAYSTKKMRPGYPSIQAQAKVDHQQNEIHRQRFACATNSQPVPEKLVQSQPEPSCRLKAPSCPANSQPATKTPVTQSAPQNNKIQHEPDESSQSPCQTSSRMVEIPAPPEQPQPIVQLPADMSSPSSSRKSLAFMDVDMDDSLGPRRPGSESQVVSPYAIDSMLKQVTMDTMLRQIITGSPAWWSDAPLRRFPPSSPSSQTSLSSHSLQFSPSSQSSQSSQSYHYPSGSQHSPIVIDSPHAQDQQSFPSLIRKNSQPLDVPLYDLPLLEQTTIQLTTQLSVVDSIDPADCF